MDPPKDFLNQKLQGWGLRHLSVVGCQRSRMRLHFKNAVPGKEGLYDSWVECFSWINLWFLWSLCRVNRGGQPIRRLNPSQGHTQHTGSSVSGRLFCWTHLGRRETPKHSYAYIYAQQENLLSAPRLASHCLLNNPCLAGMTLFCH